MKILRILLPIAITICFHYVASQEDHDLDEIFEHLEKIDLIRNSSDIETSTTSPQKSDYASNSSISGNTSSTWNSSSSASATESTNSGQDELKIISSTTEEELQFSGNDSATESGSPASTSHDTEANSTAPKEEVVLGEEPVLFPKTLIQKSIEWLNDTYTLSIALPIAAGVVFASTIIIMIWICDSCKRRCRRRRLRRKYLPDTVKNLRHCPDRAKLLAESSDEEF